MTLSNYAKTEMGFREFGEDEALVASFSSITVYEARGVTFPADTTEHLTGKVAGAGFDVVASDKVNDGCRSLVQDVFVEIEEEWRKEKNTRGPFILIQIGPTAEHKCASGWKKAEDENRIMTYDCFGEAKKELVQIEGRVLPPVVSALACVLGSPSKDVTLVKLERVAIGRAADGTLIDDVRMTFHAEGYAPHPLSQSELSERLVTAMDLASRLNSRASRFFSLALAEKDQLKRFLYFFLTLEVETHATFKTIDHAAATRTLISRSGLQGQRATQLLQAQLEGLKNLFDKFVWCAACVWNKLEESDIEQFKRLKRVRDAIAHGNISEPPPGSALEVERLARKVLWNAWWRMSDER